MSHTSNPQLAKATEIAIPLCLDGLGRFLDGPDRDGRLRNATPDPDSHRCSVL